MCSYLIMIVV